MDQHVGIPHYDVSIPSALEVLAYFEGRYRWRLGMRAIDGRLCHFAGMTLYGDAPHGPYDPSALEATGNCLAQAICRCALLALESVKEWWAQ